MIELNKFKFKRRSLLKGALVSTGALASASLLTGCSPLEFLHGVASGDPTSDSVIIWTRVTPYELDKPTAVLWVVAKDRHFNRIVAKGFADTDADRDFTVKVDVTGLESGRKYFYKFVALTPHGGFIDSPRGKTRTLPEGHVESFKVSVFSCSNYPAGFFNVYKEAAKQKVDAVLHLGDYIYEYGVGGYATEDAEALGRIPNPITEIVSLGDYRKRYAQYRSDRDLQRLHRKLPFICVWDDHEVTNDAYKDGAENHNEGEGLYSDRKAAALKAYYEWMPVRENENPEIGYRKLEVGDLLSLYMLDTRLIGRDKQLSYADYIDPATGGFNTPQFTADISDPNRTLLGTEQNAWLAQGLATSHASWQVLGQQVLVGRMNLPAPVATQQIGFSDYAQLAQLAATNPELLTPEQLAILSLPSIPYNLDAWDGYAYEREVLFETVKALGKNLVTLAGDTHNAWANDLQDLSGAAVGVEFATAGVSSPGLEAFLPDQNPDVLAAGVTQLIGPLKYANTQHRGFMTVEFKHDESVAEWIFVDTVKSKNYSVLENYGKKLKVAAGPTGRKIEEV